MPCGATKINEVAQDKKEAVYDGLGIKEFESRIHTL